MIFENSFDNLSDDEIKLINEYFDGYDYKSSSHTFLANYIWRNTHDISWQIIGEYLCVAALRDLDTESKKYVMSFPCTRTGEYDQKEFCKTVSMAREIFNANGQELEMSMIPGHLVNYLRQCYCGEVIIEHNRDDDDYIYLREDLETLSGRKLHHKKNNLNHFKKNYQYVYEEATPQMAEEILRYIEYKNEYKMGETPEEWKEILELENKAVKEMLPFLGKGLLGGVIRIDGEIMAVTLGEFAKTNSKETVLVHVEKADDRIRGLYQAINNEFVKRLPEETKYINREEDMGLENLRNSKLSYKPYEMGERFSATFTK